MTATKSDKIFQLTDLANSRPDVLQVARAQGAHVRDKDGTSLLLIREARVNWLQQLTYWSFAQMRIIEMIRHGVKPAIGDLGDLAWLRAFDLDDLSEFSDELRNALLASKADGDTAALDECVSGWRVTAKQLSDPLRRNILTAGHDPADFVDAPRPAGEVTEFEEAPQVD